MAKKTDDQHAFTARVLMSLAKDMQDLRETATRVQTQIETLAKEYGVPIPTA